MRRFLQCFVIVIVLAALAVGALVAVFVFAPGVLPDQLDLSNLNIDLDGLTGREVVALPTHTPAPEIIATEIQQATDVPVEPEEAEPTPAPPPITSSDDCEAVASASGVVVDAVAERQAQPRDRLPNGRPFPGRAPRQINLPSLPPREQVLIQFKEGTRPRERMRYLRRIDATSRRSVDGINTVLATLSRRMDYDELVQEGLHEDDSIESIEPNYIAGATQLTTPDDPRYGEQWGLPVIGAPEAWGQLPNISQQVTVAVIDSGICAAHPDLAGRIVAGFDFVEDDDTPQDEFGHGCGVAGVIAANSNNAQGIAGVAPNVNIMPLRVLDASGLGNYGDISAAIVYAADNGADIINLSLAGPQYSQVMADAVAYAIERGAIVIGAAGNAGQDQVWYPAAFPGVIAVGSIDASLARSTFSNHGARINVLAPGRDILTTSINGDYEFMTGTSFAAPHVAGITALGEIFDVPLNTEDGIVFIYPPDNIPDCS